MKFSCDNQNYKFFFVQEIIQKILQQELFLEKPTSIINKEKGKIYYR